jgi:hypothetical protein
MLKGESRNGTVWIIISKVLPSQKRAAKIYNAIVLAMATSIYLLCPNARLEICRDPVGD